MDGYCLLRVEAGRLEDPAVQLVAVGRFEPHLFQLSRLQLGQQFDVEVGNEASAAGIAQLADHHLAGIVQRRPAIGQPLARVVEAEAAQHARLVDHLRHLRLVAEGVERRDPLLAVAGEQGVERLAVGRPDGRQHR